MSTDPSREILDIAEDLYFEVKRQAEENHGWVNGWDNQPLNSITVDAKVDFIKLAEIVRAKLAEQREGIAEEINAIPATPYAAKMRLAAILIARNYGQENS